jgi:hypothetical protein
MSGAAWGFWAPPPGEVSTACDFWSPPPEPLEAQPKTHGRVGRVRAPPKEERFGCWLVSTRTEEGTSISGGATCLVARREIRNLEGLACLTCAYEPSTAGVDQPVGTVAAGADAGGPAASSEIGELTWSLELVHLFETPWPVGDWIDLDAAFTPRLLETNVGKMKLLSTDADVAGFLDSQDNTFSKVLAVDDAVFQVARHGPFPYIYIYINACRWGHVVRNAPVTSSSCSGHLQLRSSGGGPTPESNERHRESLRVAAGRRRRRRHVERPCR